MRARVEVFADFLLKALSDSCIDVNQRNVVRAWLQTRKIYPVASRCLRGWGRARPRRQDRKSSKRTEGVLKRHAEFGLGTGARRF